MFESGPYKHTRQGAVCVPRKCMSASTEDGCTAPQKPSVQKHLSYFASFRGHLIGWAKGTVLQGLGRLGRCWVNPPNMLPLNLQQEIMRDIVVDDEILYQQEKREGRGSRTADLERFLRRGLALYSLISFVITGEESVLLHRTLNTGVPII